MGFRTSTCRLKLPPWVGRSLLAFTTFASSRACLLHPGWTAPATGKLPETPLRACRAHAPTSPTDKGAREAPILQEFAGRRTVWACSVLLVVLSAAKASVAKGEWLRLRKRDPRDAEWWGKGGTMSAEAVQKAASTLTELQRYVLFDGGVEDDTDGRRFANGYEWDNSQEGVYVSAISGVPLFSSKDKMDESWLGWPGFRAPIDSKRLVVRPDPRDGTSVEVLDAASMTHLGHILDE